MIAYLGGWTGAMRCAKGLTEAPCVTIRKAAGKHQRRIAAINAGRFDDGYDYSQKSKIPNLNLLSTLPPESLSSHA